MHREELAMYIGRLERSFYTIMRMLGPELSEHLEEGLTGDQYFLLTILQNKGRMTSSELAREFRVRPSAITAMVDRMIKNEIVTRERDGRDRRVVYIKMTEKGQRVLEKSLRKRNEIMEKYLSQLERSELESLVKVYEKLATIIVKAKAEGEQS
ncbi:DNA-binding MarR family transcriptional regulator [Caldalkalibacillus uzonensis]|uniref:DNA-binding MarR family transcriptional regulator n=1 Tax=Caldalkalibacillus uzonensis TaxID=353224 RepID=A0ABU0CYE3_9BACI|nr:MarR family transcriptional regulator [Caldalkalibacillus uzonensis]MDQ0341164.1 DNA-binding MarR family transcriptional regulator [Caldalkalibacillus uzonensis]